MSAERGTSAGVAADSALAARDLGVRFGRHWAFHDVDFDLPVGAVLAIVGPNGSGKSTLVRTFLGLLRPDTGNALVFGETAERAPAEWIGYVPQIKTLDRSFPGRGIELVASGLLRRWPWRLSEARRREAHAALRLVEAEHLGDRVLGELSGGELQRMYLARAVARRPRLILLDEPATGIDIVGEATVYRFIDRCRRERSATVVMVTHDIRVASHHATHVLLLSGRQLAFGPPAAVLSEASLARAYGHFERPRGIGDGVRVDDVPGEVHG